MKPTKKYHLWDDEIAAAQRELDELWQKIRQRCPLTEAEERHFKALPWRIESLRQRQDPDRRRAYEPPRATILGIPTGD